MTKSGLGSLLLPWKFKAKEDGVINQGVTSPTFCSGQGHLWDQVSLISWVLKTCKDAAAGTVSLGPCYTVSPYSWSKNFSFQLMLVVSCPPTVYHHEGPGS